MSTAFRRIDIIDKGIYILCIGIIMLHGNFHIYLLLGSLAVDDRRIELFIAFVQIRYKLFDTALIVEYLFFFIISVITQHNP